LGLLSRLQGAIGGRVPVVVSRYDKCGRRQRRDEWQIPPDGPQQSRERDWRGRCQRGHHEFTIDFRRARLLGGSSRIVWGGLTRFVITRNGLLG
jgi:hypothetical protein